MWSTNSNKIEIISTSVAIAIISFLGTLAVVDIRNTNFVTIKTLNMYPNVINLGLGIIGIILFFVGFYFGKRDGKKVANDLTFRMADVANASNRIGENGGSVVHPEGSIVSQQTVSHETDSYFIKDDENKEIKIKKDDLSKGVKLDRQNYD